MPVPNGSRRALLLRLQWLVQSPDINSFHHLWHDVGVTLSQSCLAIEQAGNQAPFTKKKKEVQHIRGWMHLINCLGTKTHFPAWQGGKWLEVSDKDSEAL